MSLDRRILGGTELSVTALGFGGAPLGAVGARNSDDEAIAVVDDAWASGVRYFDTAPLYGAGRSERRIGAALRRRPRDEYVLSTKVGRRLVANPPSANVTDESSFEVRYDYSAEGVHRSVEESLERLGLDRIDVLLCHDIDVWTHGADQPSIYRTALDGALTAMQSLRASGVVGAIGLGVNEWQVCRQIMDVVDLDVFLLAGRFTLLEQEPLDDFLPVCVQRGVSVIIGGPYNSGLLTDVSRDQATYDYKPVTDELWERTLEIRAECDRYDVDIRAAALQYPLRHPAVAAIIPGARSRVEAAMNRTLIDTPVPAALWEELAAKGLARTVR